MMLATLISVLVTGGSTGGVRVEVDPRTLASEERVTWSHQVLTVSYDVAAASAGEDDDQRVTPLAIAPAEPFRNPLALDAIETDRQRLRVGVGAGGRAKLGFDYRLSFGP